MKAPKTPFSTGIPSSASAAQECSDSGPATSGFASAPTIGSSGPANLPPAVAARITADVVQALKDPALVERLKVLGIDTVGGNAQEYAALLAADRLRFEKIIKIAGVKAE